MVFLHFGPDVSCVLKPLSLGSQGFLNRACRLTDCGIPDSTLGMALGFTCLAECNLDLPLPMPFQTVFLLSLSFCCHFFLDAKVTHHAPDRNSTNVTQKST